MFVGSHRLLIAALYLRGNHGSPLGARESNRVGSPPTQAAGFFGFTTRLPLPAPSGTSRCTSPAARSPQPAAS